MFCPRILDEESAKSGPSRLGGLRARSECFMRQNSTAELNFPQGSCVFLRHTGFRRAKSKVRDFPLGSAALPAAVVFGTCAVFGCAALSAPQNRRGTPGGVARRGGQMHFLWTQLFRGLLARFDRLFPLGEIGSRHGRLGLFCGRWLGHHGIRGTKGLRLRLRCGRGNDVLLEIRRRDEQIGRRGLFGGAVILRQVSTGREIPHRIGGRGPPLPPSSARSDSPA